jgi:hypothetical protein
VIYSVYLKSQNHYATSAGLANMFQGKISHDQMTRHLRSKDYSSLSLWRYIIPDLRKNQSADGVLILDDTISEKPYTNQNAINYWHFSHAQHRHVKGINLLSCLVRYGDVALPIGYEVVKKDVVLMLKQKEKKERLKSVKMNILKTWYKLPWIIKSCSTISLQIVGLTQRQT